MKPRKICCENMSKDIIVLTPNGRRQKIHCTPDTSILQVLEDVCQKQGFQPSEYDLKHHNHILDLTTTIRFSNLPNKATLEMVEAERKRLESNVTIGLSLEDGERRTADFPPNTSLYDLVMSLAPSELNLLQNPAILYMRQEVLGLSAFKEKTLRQLGLIKGRAIITLLSKAHESRQANVSAVYRRPASESCPPKKDTRTIVTENGHVSSVEATAGPSNKTIDPIHFIKEKKMQIAEIKENKEVLPEEILESKDKQNQGVYKETLVESPLNIESTKSSNESILKENLERRLNIEEEVTFLGTQKAIAFMQPDSMEEFDDLPDEFYELTIEEVRKLYHNLQEQRLSLENTPLITSTKKEEIEKQLCQKKRNVYKNVVVRIQFPDHIILQGVFLPTNTIEDVNNFIKDHLHNPGKQFHIFTTPLKEALDPKLTLQEAKFVPCVHMHFKWLEEDEEPIYLKEDIYLKQTSSDAASILASKYRAPSRRKMDETSDGSQRSSVATASTSKNSKMPKWFKN